MKKFFQLLAFILFLGSISPVLAMEEPVYLAIQEEEPVLHESVEEKSGFGEWIKEKQNQVEKSKITENAQTIDPLEAEIEYDVLFERTPLLQGFTSMEFEKGPIATFKPFVGYQGVLNFDFMSDSVFKSDYESSFVEIGLTGDFRNQPISYNIVLEALPQGDSNYFRTFIKDYSLIFKYIPNNKIYVGRFRTPIGFEGGVSSYTTPFITRSQISRNFGGIRAQGTKIVGDYKFADYNIGVTSTDRSHSKFFPGVEFNGWVNLKPLGNTDGRYGKLKIGGGLNAGHNEFDYNVVGAYLSYKFRKFALESEYAISNGSNGGAGLTRNKAQGVYTTLSYNITKKLQVLARYDFFDADRTVSGNKSSEYTAGINYFIKGSALKLMLNYTYRQSDYEKNSNRIMLGTQILF